MARCKENCPSGPNNAYLMSFGDTMTALLAFFMVLNSLAEEQTGADLHAGTGSFMETVDRFGLAGKVTSDASAQAFQQAEVMPQYVVGDDEDRPPEAGASGPDEDGDTNRILDRAHDEYNRFLQQLRQVTNLEEEREVVGEFSLDIMKSFPKKSEGTLINDELRAALTCIGPMLRRDDYAIEIIVWTIMPSKSSWTKAVHQAAQLEKEARDLLKLVPSQYSRISAAGRTWIYRDVKRPYVTVATRRLKSR